MIFWMGMLCAVVGAFAAGKIEADDEWHGRQDFTACFCAGVCCVAGIIIAGLS